MILKKYKKHKEVAHNFIWRALQVVGKDGLSFLIFVICAKMLSPYEFGIYNYALAIIFFLIIFGDFGISTATSKYVAEYNATNKEKLKSVLFNSGIIVLGLTLIITIATLVVGPVYLKEKYIYVLWLLPLIFLAPMTSLYDGVYRGLRKFRQLAIISLVVGIFSISFVYILIKQYGLIGALIAQNLFYLLLFLVLALNYREVSFKLNKEVIKEVWGYSLIIGISGIGFFLFSKISTLLMGAFGFIIGISYYELINKTVTIATLPLLILSQVIAPDITELYSKKKSKEVMKKYKVYLIFSTVISLFIAGIIYFAFPFIIQNFLTKYYVSDLILGMLLLTPILITQGVVTIASVGFSTATGHARLNMYFLIIFGIINLVLNLILIPKFGFFGAIYSTLITKLSSDLLFIKIYYNALK